MYSFCGYSGTGSGALTTAANGHAWVREGPCKQPRLAGRGKYYSSPVIGDGRLYTIDERGTLSVLSAASPWDQLHSTQLAEPVYATPAIVAGRLYVRTVGTLYCFGS